MCAACGAELFKGRKSFMSSAWSMFTGVEAPHQRCANRIMAIAMPFSVSNLLVIMD